MNSIRIEPGALNGNIRIPPSKSIGHRAIICAGLAGGSSRIENIIMSQDILATVEGISALGARIRAVTNAELADEEATGSKTKTLEIEGIAYPQAPKSPIDCRESGSTLRFLLPLAALTGQTVTFTGRGRLKERPLDEYYKIFSKQGIKYTTEKGALPLTVQGSIQPGDFSLRGDISSQFISGLLFALPLLPADSVVNITTEIQSKGYIDLTLDVLHKFGIMVESRTPQEFRVKGKQKYRPSHFRVEGDYSQAAFWIVAGILNGRIDCLDLRPDSLQADREICPIVKRMGGKLKLNQEILSVRPSETSGTVIDVAQCPDLVPILAVLGSLSRGTTRIINAGRLRIKESDRLRAITTELNKLGAQVRELEEGLEIEGVENLKGGVQVDSWNDHRIAMALAVAALRCRQAVVLTGFEAVNKSYPHFWDDFRMLGGKINMLGGKIR
ncbi:MAG: 3-phosphoshikimate 1-carboxyvinyltransferase [Peptococcaceae bacterium]|nr:3-phosphoshikimate 1-carboxyvinyltransferase [Peptococcaceae bacterium]